MGESTQFEDGESVNFNFDKDKLKFKDIVLLHLKKIGDYASVEFRGGYWETKESTKTSSSNTQIQIYIADTRETYSNSIEYLHDILFPYFDDEMNKASKLSFDLIKNAYKDKTISKQMNREDQSPSEMEAIDERKKVIGNFKSTGERATFRDYKIQINRDLFRSMCCFLYRKRYLEISGIDN